MADGVAGEQIAKGADGAATPSRARAARGPARAFHPFLPKSWSRPEALRWLKKVHAWTGLWGAVTFLLVGFTGVLLNHRSVMKIDTGAAREVSAVVIPVEPGAIATIEDLGEWGKTELDLKPRPRINPRRATPGETVLFMGKEVAPTQIWRQRFYAPNAIVYLEYMPGSAGVKATKLEQNLMGFMKNLHKGAGLGVAWVLFFDMMAGALIAMSLTGFLLWSRLHGPRLAAIGLGIGSVVLGAFAAWPAVM